MSGRGMMLATALGACLAPLALLPLSASLWAQSVIPTSAATAAATARALRDTALVHEVPGRFSVKLVGGDGLGPIPPDLRAPMLRNVDSIVALVRRDPAIAPPKGVDVVVHTYVGRDTTSAGRTIAVGYIKIFLWPYAVHDGAVWQWGSAHGVNIAVNHPLCADSAAGFGFTFAPTTDTFHGYPLRDSVLVITHRPVPACLPVTREEYLQAMRKARTIAPSASRYSPEELREQDEAFAELAKRDPKQAAALRKAWQAEMQREQRMTDSIGGGLAQHLTQYIAKLTPAELASPAYLSGQACDEQQICLAKPDTPGARMVVRMNPAFFDPSRPADVQLITVDLSTYTHDGNYNDPVLLALLMRMVNELDWHALEALAK